MHIQGEWVNSSEDILSINSIIYLRELDHILNSILKLSRNGLSCPWVYCFISKLGFFILFVLSVILVAQHVFIIATASNQDNSPLLWS